MKGIFIKKKKKFVDPQFVSSTMDSFRLSWPDICLARTGFSYMYRQWHSSVFLSDLQFTFKNALFFELKLSVLLSEPKSNHGSALLCN